MFHEVLTHLFPIFITNPSLDVKLIYCPILSVPMQLTQPFQISPLSKCILTFVLGGIQVHLFPTQAGAKVSPLHVPRAYLIQKFFFFRSSISLQINMFHVFALAYLTNVFLWLPCYFSSVLRATSVRVNRSASAYCKASYTFIAKYTKMIAKCEKQKVYGRVFCLTSFFRILHPFFRFSHFTAFCARVGICSNSQKDFVVHFFATLIKYKIRMKREKCIVSVSYFVMCFAKTFEKYPQNAKYKSV